ncbi:MAG: hypothetical protein J6X71_08715 [Bacteroidales bacterium]|nr:hypothetical protein [Bacteroidales bacterium]
MKRGYILLFLLSVYALIVAAGFAFPEEGISIGPVSVIAPSPADFKAIFVREEKAPEGPSPEELLQQRLAEIHRAEQDTYDAFIKESPARMHFPQDDVTLLDPFFRALEAANSTPVRILHYGDSQIEEDRISSTLRTGLQERFGGGGPGLLPFGRPYYTQGFSQTSTATLHRALVFGEGTRRSGGRYGVMGQLARIDTSVFTTVSAVKGNKGPSRHFNRLTMLAGNVSTLNVKCGSRQYRLGPVKNDSGVGRIVIPLADSSSTVRFSTWGSADVYGFQLDDSLGVSLDNIPMRGCSGTVFTNISSAQLREYVAADNVRMIILQFGGNSIPYRKTAKSISEYKASLEKQIRHLKGIAPGAFILFIGPSDMSTSVKGRMQTYPHLPMMVDSLKAAALECGAAYWDMYQAMGGENSMVQWVKARPQLAGSDYVHFTPRGAEAVGNMLLESMMLYYDYYLWRNGRKPE